jgi:hypothetical protein
MIAFRRRRRLAGKTGISGAAVFRNFFYSRLKIRRKQKNGANFSLQAINIKAEIRSSFEPMFLSSGNKSTAQNG